MGDWDKGALAQVKSEFEIALCESKRMVFIMKQKRTHIDVIAESFNITSANSVCTPGMKTPDPNTEPEDKTENAIDNNSTVSALALASNGCGWECAQHSPELLCAITGDENKLSRHVSSNLNTSNHGVRSFSRLEHMQLYLDGDRRRQM